MRYLPSFRTSLRLSRDLFRILGLMLWGMGVFITLFFLYTQFNESKSDIRQQFYSGFENMQAFILQTGTTLRSIQFMTEQHEDKLESQPDFVRLPATGSYSLYPLSSEANCEYFKTQTSAYLTAFEQLIYFWKDSIAAPQGLNHIYVIGSKSYCMMDYPIRTTVSDIEVLKKIGYDLRQIQRHIRNVK